jgi:dienelactone hydrolase
MKLAPIFFSLLAVLICSGTALGQDAAGAAPADALYAQPGQLVSVNEARVNLYCMTSGNHGVGHLETAPADTPEHVKYEQEMTLGQARWLGLSSNAKQIFARHSSEYIQFDEPDTVISAIREVYDQSAPAAQQAQPPAARVVDLKTSDGTPLKATYFAAAKPGPGVLLFHQFNRTRKDWDDVARQLAAAGINTLTFDRRGYGESGGTPYDKLTDAESAQVREHRLGDIDTAWQYLVSQPGVKRDVIGVGGAGESGVGRSVQAAMQHPAQVKSLVLLSGETLRDGLQFLRQASQLPGLFVVSDDDEYPPTAEAMEWLYIASSNPGKKFVHYSAAEDAPWLWYEDVPQVPAAGAHGTDLFKTHPELPGIIVHWFVTTLIKTPGHAPADALASATILNQLEMPGGVAQVTQQLMEARRKDPQAQLWPEINVDIIGSDYLREGDPKHAIEIFKLNLLAYPDSADAHFNLADAYLRDGQKDLARQYAEKALAMLDSHAAPLSSWSDTEQRRGEIRNGVLQTLKKLGENKTN